MSKREIKKYPQDDEILRKKCVEVKRIDRFLKLLIEDMIEAMNYGDGVGLAASQVGISKRVIVCKINEAPEIFINPRITKKTGSQIGLEGCLSVPGIFGEVERAESITVKAQGPSGKFIKLNASSFLARVFQHEIDHLDGILFIDKAKNLKKVQPEELQDVI